MTTDDPRHGTTRGYHAGCRDLCCRRAMARYEKQGRLARQRGGRAVPALGAKRRLQALLALGWSSHAIAVHAGLKHRNHVWRILHGQNGKPTVWLERSTDAWVRKVYDELSMTVPEGTYAKRTRAYAEQHGYLPPLAWDNIDDPDEKPATGSTRVTYKAAELLAEWDHLMSLGVSEHVALAQLGVTRDALQVAAKRVKGAA